jgi:flagellar hook-basal body complex protein FliE
MSDIIVGSPFGSPAPVPAAKGGAAGYTGRSFLDTISESIQKVENDHRAAEQSVQDLATGRRKTLHETMIAVEKADVSFRMLLAVRNKLLSAYQEVMRMQF